MPSDDMFCDDAHLNTKKGIPFIIKFLKRVLNIPSTQTRRPSLSDSSMPKSKLEPPPNYRYSKNGPLDVNNNRPPHPLLDDISNNQFRLLMPPIPPFNGHRCHSDRGCGVLLTHTITKEALGTTVDCNYHDYIVICQI